jgi:hypothetical protein
LEGWVPARGWASFSRFPVKLAATHILPWRSISSSPPWSTRGVQKQPSVWHPHLLPKAINGVEEDVGILYSSWANTAMGGSFFHGSIRHGRWWGGLPWPAPLRSPGWSVLENHLGRLHGALPMTISSIPSQTVTNPNRSPPSPLLIHQIFPPWKVYGLVVSCDWADFFPRSRGDRRWSRSPPEGACQAAGRMRACFSGWSSPTDYL